MLLLWKGLYSVDNSFFFVAKLQWSCKNVCGSANRLGINLVMWDHVGNREILSSWFSWKKLKSHMHFYRIKLVHNPEKFSNLLFLSILFLHSRLCLSHSFNIFWLGFTSSQFPGLQSFHYVKIDWCLFPKAFLMVRQNNFFISASQPFDLYIAYKYIFI